MAAVQYEDDLKLQAERRKVLKAEAIPFFLDKIDEMAKLNDGHLALKRLTWADLYFSSVYDYMNFMASQDITAKHENIRKVVDTVFAIESIKQWIAERPVTES